MLYNMYINCGFLSGILLEVFRVIVSFLLVFQFS